MTNRSAPRLLTALIFVSASALHCARAETWTYRGDLRDAGRPAQGEYALRMRLYDAASGGRAIGSEITVPSVQVRDGAFAADVDFGVTLAHAPPLWLEVEVAAPHEGFTSLGARQAFDAKAALAGVCWDTQGNAALAGDYLGTTNAQPLELKVNSARVARYEPDSVSPNVINGNPANAVTTGVRGATIGGGGVAPGDSDPAFTGEQPNLVTDAYGTVAGGYGNQAGDGAGFPTDRAFATVGGGMLNVASGDTSTVIGGAENLASGSRSVVGGHLNVAAGFNSIAMGGEQDQAIGPASTVIGGDANVAIGIYSSVVGGASNTASGAWSVAGGDLSCAGGSVSWAGGSRAKVRPGSPGPGGCVGVPQGPAGSGDANTFVWSDGQASDFVSTGSDQFMIRATGGVAINGAPISDNTELTIVADSDGSDIANLFLQQRASSSAGVLISAGNATGPNNAELYVDQFNGSGQTRRLILANNGDLTVTANAFKPGGGTWAAVSDARLKQNIHAIATPLARVLALRGVEFEYRPGRYADAAPGPQIGFVAQEVERVMPDWVGKDADGYRYVAVKGFEALAVEALRELKTAHDAVAADVAAQREALDARLKRLDAENGALREDLAAMRRDNDALRGQVDALLRAVVDSGR